jgi:hypothetical protein
MTAEHSRGRRRHIVTISEKGGSLSHDPFEGTGHGLPPKEQQTFDAPDFYHCEVLGTN